MHFVTLHSSKNNHILTNIQDIKMSCQILFGGYLKKSKGNRFLKLSISNI